MNANLAALMRPWRALAALIALLLPACAAHAASFDVNGVALGGTEADVLKSFPGARCKALEWRSDAAERRCDDARIVVAGAQARITVYLKGGAVQAFDLRFDSKSLEPLDAHFRKAWGKPASESRDKVFQNGKEVREVYKVAWQRGRDRAVLISLSSGKRASLSAARGNFDEEIYRVK